MTLTIEIKDRWRSFSCAEICVSCTFFLVIINCPPNMCILHIYRRNNMRKPVDVLICGAGAAGLTLAIELARRGVRFALIDKLASPFLGSRGKGIQPRTQEVFEDLGILDRAMAAGGIYPTIRKYSN